MPVDFELLEVSEGCPHIDHLREFPRARRLDADDPQLLGWSFAPGCTGTLRLDGVVYPFTYFLGGLVRMNVEGAQEHRLLPQR